MTKKGFLTALCAFSLCTMLIFKGTAMSDGIRRGLYLCSNSVIPSLFPFMALSVFICESSASDFFSFIFKPVTKFLKLPENCGGILIPAIFGGYPAAAKCINDYVSEGFIGRKTAAKMLCFCVNASPGFLIGTIGAGIFGSIEIGFLIFAAHFLSSVIIAAVLSVFSKKEKSFSFPYIKPEKSNSVCVVESIISAAESCFRMCAFIIVACGILEVVFEGAFLGYAGKNPLLKSFVSGFFEVTAGVVSCRDIAGYGSVIAAGAIASFSGISVIFQIAAVTDESKIPLFPFILSRFFHSGTTALILKIFLLFSGKNITVLSFNGGKTEAVLSASAPAAVSLLCMAALFLLSVVPPKSEKEPLLSRIRNKFEKFWHSQTQ